MYAELGNSEVGVARMRDIEIEERTVLAHRPGEHGTVVGR
jgi:hypothetical protein